MLTKEFEEMYNAERLLFCSNVKCGTLQCKEGERQPTPEGMDQLNSRTIISIKGVEYECK